MNVNVVYDRLKIIENLPLRYFGRACNLFWIGFGKLVKRKNSRGIYDEIAEYSLHIQCPWRIVRNNVIVIASQDIYIPKTNIEWTEDFDWDVQGENIFDEKTNQFFSNYNDNLIVSRVLVDEYGGLEIDFNDEFKLQIFPSASVDEEVWRFFKTKDLNSHFVVTGIGVQDEAY